MKKTRIYLPLLISVMLCALAIGSSAALASPPVYDGAMTFPAIYSSAEPEEFFWEVILYEGQELRQIDEQELGVYYSEGPRAFAIQAVPAHDAVGTTVPTTIQKTGENVFTLTVHHREGNPAAAGAPFDYPVVPGTGWEGGFVPMEVEGPPDETELREQREREERQAAEVAAQENRCRVPALHGATVAGARRRLRRAKCRLGAVTRSSGVTRKTGRVVHQTEQAGSTLAQGARVGIKLGPRG